MRVISKNRGIPNSQSADVESYPLMGKPPFLRLHQLRAGIDDRSSLMGILPINIPLCACTGTLRTSFRSHLLFLKEL